MLQKDNNNIERESQAGSHNDNVRAVGGRGRSQFSYFCDLLHMNAGLSWV